MLYIEELRTIASVRTGYTFREKIETRIEGDILVLQPKDIQDKSVFTDSARVQSSTLNSLETHVLKGGDILITNKGLKFAVFLFNKVQYKSIASSSFFVISPNQDVVIPEYLIWYLGQDDAKNYLVAKATGTVIPSITKPTIERLKVTLPSLETQKQIVELLQITSEELQKLAILQERKKELYNTFIWEAIDGEKEK